MIKSFAFAGRPFSLVPDAVLNNPDLNIFSADSMTLLVGPNGSGKTRALLSLAHAISSKAHDVEIDWKEKSSARSTSALYFTSIPYAIKLPNENRHFSALFPKVFRGEVLPEVETALSLASEFGLRASPILKLAPLQGVLDVVKDLLFYPFKTNRPVYKFVDKWMEPLAAREQEIAVRRVTLSRARRESGMTFSEMFDSEEYATCLQDEATLSDDIVKEIEKNLGDEAFLKIRAVAIVRKSQRYAKDVKMELLAKLGLTTTEKPSKIQHKASSDFDAALASLRFISQTLNGSKLKNTVQKLSLEQWSKLSAINLSGIAQLTITGVSSGASALLDQFARLKISIEKIAKDKKIRNLVLLIDEGDAFLHLEWQQKYINFLDLTVKRLWRDRFDCIQIVLTTHSPVLMSDFPKDCIHRFEEQTGDLPIHSGSEILSFGAPLDAIVRGVGGAGSLGTFSVRIMRDIFQKIEDGVLVKKYHIDMIDDPIINRHIMRVLQTKNKN